jgi:hypothetical protein
MFTLYTLSSLLLISNSLLLVQSRPSSNQKIQLPSIDHHFDLLDHEHDPDYFSDHNLPIAEEKLENHAELAEFNVEHSEFTKHELNPSIDYHSSNLEQLSRPKFKSHDELHDDDKHGVDFSVYFDEEKLSAHLPKGKVAPSNAPEMALHDDDEFVYDSDLQQLVNSQVELDGNELEE